MCSAQKAAKSSCSKQASGCLGTLPALQDAGKVELDGASYLGFSLPFTVSQLCWIEAILVRRCRGDSSRS